MKERVYISGPITGMPDGNKMAFQHAEYRLARLGFIPVNPCHILPPTWPECSYRDHMTLDIQALMGCDMIHMLPNWESSKGAILEKHIADVLGIMEYK